MRPAAAASLPGIAEELTRTPPVLRRRVRHALRRAENWRQVVRFVAVGASGFVVNITTFAFVFHVLGVDYRVAAVLGVAAGVANNFVWHRHWTFGAHDGHAGFQALRFVVVYGVTFLVALLLLQLFVDAGMPEVLAQAASQLLVTPLNFLGHKLWSFDD